MFVIDIYSVFVGGPKSLAFCVRIEIGLVSFWVVDIDLISVREIELDLISVLGSELILVCALGSKTTWF